MSVQDDCARPETGRNLLRSPHRTTHSGALLADSRADAEDFGRDEAANHMPIRSSGYRAPSRRSVHGARRNDNRGGP